MCCSSGKAFSFKPISNDMVLIFLWRTTKQAQNKNKTLKGRKQQHFQPTDWLTWLAGWLNVCLASITARLSDLGSQLLLPFSSFFKLKQFVTIFLFISLHLRFTTTTYTHTHIQIYNNATVFLPLLFSLYFHSISISISVVKCSQLKVIASFRRNAIQMPLLPRQLGWHNGCLTKVPNNPVWDAEIKYQIFSKA